MTEVGRDKHLFLFRLGLFVNLGSAVPVAPAQTISHVLLLQGMFLL